MCDMALRFIGMAIALAWAPLNATWAESNAQQPQWTSRQHFRVLLSVDGRDRARSHSPASVEIDFQSLLRSVGEFDEHSVAVIALDDQGQPTVFDGSRSGDERWLVPHRLDRLFGSSNVTLNFVVRDQTCERFAVYFDSAHANRSQPRRYPGLVGDGDRFREEFQRREITASHFDQFVDFDGDGDLDLFKGGVEPFVDCYENLGGNLLAARGRLASAGRLFTLPCSKDGRSWLTVAFYDVDEDGDQDFLPSFGDGPDAGRIVFYRNTTQRGGVLTFDRVGPRTTASGTPLAGGTQAGGWLPSITLVKGFAGERLDAIVGSKNQCWLYRGRGFDSESSPSFDDAVALQADYRDISLINPRFDCADIDADGDLDLFAGTQPGSIWLFENTGSRMQSTFAAGRVVALDGKYLIGDAHSGVKVADFDGDGLLDIVAGRFWERTDLTHSDLSRDFGGFFRNVGTRAVPRFERTWHNAPATEQVQICDAVRQNCVRSVDWDRDGKLDLLAGDTDGLIWLFRNQTNSLCPLFAVGKRLEVGGQSLSVADKGGHARFDVCDWNHDGQRDLLVADGQGTLSLFLGREHGSQPALDVARSVLVEGRPLQGAGRASVLVCDWDQDGRQDIVFADEKGYYWHRNTGSDKEPTLSSAADILFNGRRATYVRPNLGSYVDWDGDGKRDFIGCNFENSVRLYVNVGSGSRGEPPRFSDAEGDTILRASAPQMISGCHAIDWNGDGDLDLLTGQGHGGSGLRFFERDWLEDELQGTHPRVSVGPLELK